MTENAKRFVVFGTIAGIGLIIAIIAIAGSSASPRAFLRDTYSCSPDPTDVDSSTCDANGTPDSVADAIAADTSPVDRGSKDGKEFLQYEDDIVAVTAQGSGSTVTIDDYETGYHRYGSTYFGFFGWTSYRPSSGGGYGGGGYGGGGK